MKLIPKITPEIIELLRFTPLQYMLRTLENTPMHGMVYADDAKTPSTCVVRLGCELIFGGNATPECLSYVKNKILTFEIYETYGTFYLFYPNESWQSALTALFLERCSLQERSLYGTKSTAAKIDIPSAIIPITPQLMESDVRNKEMIINEIRGINRFFKNNGFGYALLIDGEICGFCTSEYHSVNELAANIEVTEANRKKGYAKAMIAAFLDEAIGKGYKVYWEAQKDDTPSINTALSCGFQHIADYPAIFLNLCDMDRAVQEPKDYDVLNAAQKYLPDIKSIKRVPKGGSTYVYQIKTSSELCYARFLPEDCTFAVEATAHKIMTDLGVQVPQIIAYEDKEAISGQSMMLISEIPGVCMEESCPENPAEILREAGRQLALIHSIPVDGFGWIDRNSHDMLKGEKNSFLEYFDNYLADDLVCLNYYECPDEEKEQIRSYMEQAKSMLDVQSAVLVHGDFDISHIYHESGKFSGFIDFGEIRGNNRLYDLAQFSYVDSSPDRSAYYHLIDGYRETAQLTDDDLYAIELMALFIVLRFAGKKVEELIDDDLENLQDDFWYGLVRKQLERINHLQQNPKKQSS